MTIADTRQRVIAGRGPGRVTIGVRGALEGSAIDALRQAASEAFQPGMDLIIDLSEVTALGPEGLAAIAAVGVLAGADDGSFLIRPPMATVDVATELARLLHPAGRGR